MDRHTLDKLLIQAHAKEDASDLIALYTIAADQCEIEHDIDRACFYLTHAYVFALELGAVEADALNLRLVQYGRETRQVFPKTV